MVSTYLKDFLDKGIVYSTDNDFSKLLKPLSGTLKTTVASKSSSGNAKSKKTSSVKIVQSIKSNKTSL